MQRGLLVKYEMPATSVLRGGGHRWYSRQKVSLVCKGER